MQAVSPFSDVSGMPWDHVILFDRDPGAAILLPLFSTHPMVTHSEELPDVREIHATHARTQGRHSRKQDLLALRGRFTGTVRKSMGNLADTTSAEPDDYVGSAQTETVQLTEREILESAATMLEQVNRTLLRIRQGVRNECENCGTKIPKVRLAAIPYATTCVRCAAEAEGTSNDEPVKQRPKPRPPKVREA